MVKLKNNSLREDRSSQIVSWGHWFALFNIFLVIILGSRYLLIADWPPTLLGRIYAIISCIGHFSFLTFAVYLVLLFPLSFFIHSDKWQRVVTIIIATIGLTLLLIDIEVFARFRMHLNFSIWQILTSPDDNILTTRWQKIFIFVPFILLLETFFAIWSWRKLRSLTKRRRYSRPIIMVFIVCFLSSHLIHIWADANFYRPITMQRSSLPVSYPLTARHFLEKYGFIQAGKYESRIVREGNPFAMAIEYPLGKINYQPIESPYNILMIVVNDWNDVDQINRMPNLTAFAEQHIQFTQHYSASNYAHLGVFSLFYGLDPNYYNSILASHKSSVFIDTLGKQHYNIGLFSADGFNHPFYRYALLSNFTLPTAKKLSNIEISNHWLSWYQQQSKSENGLPWFSTIQYKMDKLSKVGVEEQVKDLDNAMAKVFAALQQNNALDKTIVVITAANIRQNNPHFDRNLLHVPLIMAWPNKDGMNITMPTTHVDIMQTLMQNVLNVTTPTKQYSQGIDLFSTHQRQWLIVGEENEIAALYPDKTIIINNQGSYRIEDLNNRRMKKEKLSLSTFLQLITENRRFMVTN